MENTYDTELMIQKYPVGTWVINPTFGEYTPFQIKSSYFRGVSRRNLKWFDGLKLWRPDEGEWCWYFKDGFTKPDFRKFKTSKYNQDIYHNYNPKVEPFIGTLPDLILDLKD